MAISALRLRRNAFSLSSFIFNHNLAPLSSFPSQFEQIAHSSSQNPKFVVPNFVSQVRAFRSSNISLARPRTSYNNDDDMKIGPDDILFEGCDYNHWLITIDFPKDPKPSPEEMVETYVQTAAKVLGSVEEAKKKIYACSTTTYTGFQVQVTEDVSKKFEGLPGVVFILPDSYIDPVNKEYGGDKYDNGIITHRPPPIQYQRAGGRFADRNRDFNRPNRPQGEYQQGNPAYDNRGSTQGSAGNFGSPQNPPPQQNYSPPRVAPLNNSPGGHENYQGQKRDQMPPNQGNYNQSQRGDSYPQGQRVPPGEGYSRDQMPPNQGNYNQGQRGDSYPQGQRVPSRELNSNAPLQGGNFRQEAGGSYGQGASGSYGQGAAGNYGQGAAGNYGQGAAGNGGQGAAGNYRQGAGGNNWQGATNYGPGTGGNFGQGAGGNFGQGAGGNFGQGAGGNFGQGATGSFGQGASGSFGQGTTGSFGQGATGSFGQGATGSFGQGATGSFGQGATGSFGQGTVGAVPGEEKFFNYGQTNSVHGENQSISQGERMNDPRQVHQ